MTVKISTKARAKDYRAILGNTVSIVEGFDNKLSLHGADASIITKAMIAGKGYIIEDTTLTINENTYNAVSREDTFNNNDKAVWSTKMTYHSGYMIHFYEADIDGHIRIDPLVSTEKFFFGDIFVPQGYDMTLSEIEKRDNIDFTNARQLALMKLLAGESYHVEIIEPIFHQDLTAHPETELASI